VHDPFRKKNLREEMSEQATALVGGVKKSIAVCFKKFFEKFLMPSCKLSVTLRKTIRVKSEKEMRY